MADPSATVVERLAEWIADVTYDDIPPRVLRRARYQWASTVAAMHASVTAGGAVTVARVAARWDKRGASTVVPTGESYAVHEAVWVNAARSIALDYDDYLYMGHTGHSAVLASWAVCESLGLDTRAMLVAQVIANEIGGRLGASCVLGPQNGQAWSFIHAAGAAAAAGRLYGLDREQLADALAIALYQPPFNLWPGFMGPTSKELTASGPTVGGIIAAELAAEGMTGARDIIEHPRRGLWAHFAYVPLPGMLSGLGNVWLTDTLAYKPYPGCAYVTGVLDAIFEILAAANSSGDPVMPADVTSVDVDASLLTIEMDNLSVAYRSRAQLSPVAINFSVAHNVAIAIIAGRLGGTEMAPSFLARHEQEIHELAAKVNLHHDWGMTGRVIDSFTGVVGLRDVARNVGPANLVALISGLGRQLGGRKRTTLSWGALLGAGPSAWRSLGRRVFGGGGRGAARNGELAGADLSTFAMTLPARVVLRTIDRELIAEREVPAGAPGAGDYGPVVMEKLRRETQPHLGTEKTAELCAVVESPDSFDSFDSFALSDLAALVCAPNLRTANGSPGA